MTLNRRVCHGRFTKSKKDPLTIYTTVYSSCFVHNVIDTNDEPIPEGCVSFLDYWEKKTGVSAPKECQVIASHENQDSSDADKKILPLHM